MKLFVCWGRNDYGQIGVDSDEKAIGDELGDYVDVATSTPDLSPTTVALSSMATALTNPTMIEAGEHHTCSGNATQMRCWGLNSSGQLGDSSTTNKKAF